MINICLKRKEYPVGFRRKNLSKDFLQTFDFFLNNSVKLNEKLKVISLSFQLIQR